MKQHILKALAFFSVSFLGCCTLSATASTSTATTPSNTSCPLTFNDEDNDGLKPMDPNLKHHYAHELPNDVIIKNLSGKVYLPYQKEDRYIRFTHEKLKTLTLSLKLLPQKCPVNFHWVGDFDSSGDLKELSHLNKYGLVVITETHGRGDLGFDLPLTSQNIQWATSENNKLNIKEAPYFWFWDGDTSDRHKKSRKNFDDAYKILLTPKYIKHLTQSKSPDILCVMACATAAFKNPTKYNFMGTDTTATAQTNVESLITYLTCLFTGLDANSISSAFKRKKEFWFEPLIFFPIKNKNTRYFSIGKSEKETVGDKVIFKAKINGIENLKKDIKGFLMIVDTNDKVSNGVYKKRYQKIFEIDHNQPLLKVSVNKDVIKKIKNYHYFVGFTYKNMIFTGLPTYVFK